MAWVVTSRYTANQDASSADYVSGSFTPAADAMLIAFFYHTDDGGVPTGITGHDGGTSWAQMSTYDNGTGRVGYDCTTWRCLTGSSPSAGTVTLSHNYHFRSGLFLIEISENANGIDVSSGFTSAHGTDDLDGGYNTTPLTATLAAFANSSNLTMSMYWGNTDELSGSWDDGSYTALTALDTGQMFLEPYYKTSEDTSISSSFNAFKNNAVWGLEIKQAAGGGTRHVLFVR